MAKYDDDFKSFAADHCLETGSIRSCVRDLGVARNTLAAWLRESKAPMKPSKPSAAPRTSCPEAAKRLALGLYYVKRWTLSEASMALGMPATTISAWKTRHVDAGLVDLPTGLVRRIRSDNGVEGELIVQQNPRLKLGV